MPDSPGSLTSKDDLTDAERQDEIGVGDAEIYENKEEKTIQVREQWAGPLPPPDYFNHYPEIAQNEIVGMMRREAEYRHEMHQKEMTHNHAIEKKTTDAEIDQAKQGQKYALWIVLVVVSLYSLLVYKGHEAFIIMVGIIPAIEPIFMRILKILSIRRKSDGKRNGEESQSDDS